MTSATLAGVDMDDGRDAHPELPRIDPSTNRPFSVGAWIDLVIRQRGITPKEFAARAGMSEHALWRLRTNVARHALTPETAYRLSRASGLVAIAWMHQDAKHRWQLFLDSRGSAARRGES